MKNRREKPKLNYNAANVWAFAVEAYRVLGGYFKEPLHKYNESGDWVQVRPSNRDMVTTMLKTIEPTEEQLARGREYREFWQAQIMLLLTNRAGDFVKATIAAAELDVIDTGLDIAIIVSSIESAEKLKARQDMETRKYSLNSKHRFSTGAKIVLDNAEVIRCQYIDKVGAYSVECIIDGDLYVWWSSHGFETKTYRKLRGRLKSHDYDFATKIPANRITHVKVEE